MIDETILTRTAAELPSPVLVKSFEYIGNFFDFCTLTTLFDERNYPSKRIINFNFSSGRNIFKYLRDHNIAFSTKIFTLLLTSTIFDPSILYFHDCYI